MYIKLTKWAVVSFSFVTEKKTVLKTTLISYKIKYLIKKKNLEILELKPFGKTLESSMYIKIRSG